MIYNCNLSIFLLRTANFIEIENFYYRKNNVNVTFSSFIILKNWEHLLFAQNDADFGDKRPFYFYRYNADGRNCYPCKVFYTMHISTLPTSNRTRQTWKLFFAMPDVGTAIQGTRKMFE